MAHTQSIFDRLRSMQTEGQPLHALIVEACEVGNELLAALNGYVTYIEPSLNAAVQAGYDNTPHVRLMDAAKAALARARPDNGDTPTNGARKSA